MAIKGRKRESTVQLSPDEMERGTIEPTLSTESFSSYDSLYEPAITGFGETIAGELRDELSRDS